METKNEDSLNLDIDNIKKLVEKLNPKQKIQILIKYSDDIKYGEILSVIVDQISKDSDLLISMGKELKKMKEAGEIYKDDQCARRVGDGFQTILSCYFSRLKNGAIK